MIRHISLVLLLSIVPFSCRENKIPQQKSDPVETEQKTSPRYVERNTLVSKTLPEIEIEVSGEFDYIGTFPFEIIANSEEYPPDLQGKPVAAGDRYVFVSADSVKVVNKLFIVQLEGFLPNNDFVYNYNFDNAESIGSNKYRHNTWFYDSKKLAEENPANEGALTRTFLTEKGFSLENQFMMSRFVGLASEDRKHEILIYYIEMLHKTTGYTLEEYEVLNNKRLTDSIRNALVDRSYKSFKIIKG